MGGIGPIMSGVRAASPLISIHYYFEIEERMKSISLALSLLALSAGQEAPTPTPAPYVQHFDPIGVIALVAFYIIVLGVGIWASKKQKADTAVELALAGRNFSGLMGVITMVATWVCGGYLYGTTQGIVTEGSGLAWTQAPWGYAVCFFFGAILFASKMREKNYLTMFDPFSEKFKKWMVALLYLPACLGDVFWIAMALSTLGACLSVLLGVNAVVAILVSAVFSCVLAFIGGMYSVAYTDVVQLVIMFVCLFICIPFVGANEAVGDITENTSAWLGSIAAKDAGIWADSALLLMFGGIPWQVYFQRVLSSRSVKDAKIMSYWSGVGALLCAVPPAIMGIYGTTVDWSQFPEVGTLQGKESFALSYIIKYLTPKFVSYMGLGGIAAATLSTADGAYLASATVFTINVYKPLFHPKASEKEITIVARITMIVICVLGTILAITSDSVYDLWVLTSDFIYALLFPQLLLVIYCKKVNTYGSLMGFLVGAFLRFGGGQIFNLPKFLPYPDWFPFRTLAMLCALLVEYLVSALFYQKIVVEGKKNWDFMGDYKTELAVKESDKPAEAAKEPAKEPVKEEPKEGLVEAPKEGLVEPVKEPAKEAAPAEVKSEEKISL